MTKFIAAIFSLALLAATLPAQACMDHSTTAQTTPVVTSDANGTAPMTPIPTTTTTAPKTGG
jgi:hypothetical protein